MRPFFNLDCCHFISYTCYSKILGLGNVIKESITKYDAVKLSRAPSFKPLNKFALLQLHAKSPLGKLALFLYKYFEGSKEAYDILRK